MGPGSAFAIYLLIWTVTLFVVLPFGVRTHDEEGEEKVSGQADSAPVRPMIIRKLLWNTVLAAIVFGLLWANYEFGWIGVEDLPSW